MSSNGLLPPNMPPPPPPKPNKQQNGETEHYYDNGIGLNGNNNCEYQQNGNSRSSCHTPPQTDREQVVMTPKGKTSNSTVILIERKLVNEINERVHVAGGEHTGIIINKDTSAGQKSANVAAHLSLEFRVFLVSANSGKHSQESRTLRFWYRSWLNDEGKMAQVAQDFFRELVSPKDFPRDYVGFIKKIMKLMQKGYDEIQALEVELRILEETSAPPSRPLSIDESQLESPPLTQEKVLELIEQAYPNPITAEDLAKDYGWEEADVTLVIQSLISRGLIKSMEYNSYTRIHHEDKEIKVVKQMPTISSNKQPTIAIVTAQYCEKMAVDAMLENKETFVRYTTVDLVDQIFSVSANSLKRKKKRFGESNVYTLGNIGAHRIVTTKLPSIGSTREAMTAAGNTTTRLLGTFQKVDYVFLVGVAGGVPHFTDYKKHVRLGDVVVSCSNSPIFNGNKSTEKPYVYVYKCGDDVKTYYPKNDCLQEIAKGLQSNSNRRRPWEDYQRDAMKTLALKTETDFEKPAANTDKLYMNIGNKEVIEVAHPIAQDTTDGLPSMRIHLGAIGSGRDFIKSDNSRNDFAKNHNLLATDVELSSVLDSIIGNCRDSFILVKGISDYKDGMSTRKWQNYASLSAASVVKSIICGMDAPTNV
ncbi:hypothetical protein ACFFRR_002473 [Megaselia abdita]